MITGRLWLVALLLTTSLAHAQTDVLASRYDSGRTGQNLSETTLTTQNVNVRTFGKVYSFAVDGFTYAQPLVKSNLAIPAGTFNVVFVATQHGSVYALDADTATPLWRQSFFNPAAGITSRPADVGSDILPEISITSTPVIDPVAGTLYVVAETQQTGAPAYYYLHALDIATGADKVTPALIQASVGTGVTPLQIDAATSQQRPGLVLSNGVVYVGFGSNGDAYPWVGWLVGYDAATLAQVTVFCTSADGSQGAGLWSSGEAPPVDVNGNIFLSTGNGSFDGSSDWADSIVKLSTAGGLSVSDYFTPFNQAALASADLDVASAGITLLPDSAGTSAHPHLLVGSGKDGEVYVVDRDNMGHFDGSYNTPNSQIVQWISGAVGGSPISPLSASLPYVENSYTTPAFWQNRVYFCGVDDYCKLFTLSNGLLSTTPVSQSSTIFGYHGSQPVVSAASSSATRAILWAVQGDSTNSVAVLHAYDATNLATEFYNSNQAGNRDQGGAPVKFAVPTVANGKVFVGAGGELDVYGLLAGNPQRLATPTFSPTPTSYANAQAVTITAHSGARIYYTLDGSLPTLSSAAYSGPITVSATTTLNAIAVQSGFLTSPVATATYTFTPTAAANLTATTANRSQIKLAWTAATETGGTISAYLVERCQGSGCANFAQIGTSTSTTFADAGLAAATSYSYRVRAQDSASHTGPYSGTATASTTAGVPTAPAHLAATAGRSAQINLTWGAATQTGGTIRQYRIERCQGADCGGFTQIATSTTVSFSDATLSGNTTYSYRVRAADASGNTGPYSNVASARTAAPPRRPRTGPMRRAPRA